MGGRNLHLSLILTAGRHDACMQPYALVMAALIVAIGLCYGLDGRDLVPVPCTSGGLPPEWGVWAREQVTKAGRAFAWPMAPEQVRNASTAIIPVLNMMQPIHAVLLRLIAFRPRFPSADGQ